ncbi:MAG: hypothetical protein IKB64_03025 [Paludibacteraceae bacterium]|nr:hypothetical protein [Paludibacteraceae bacterium]
MMIPLIDAYLREIIQDRLKFLKNNPQFIEQIFGTLGTKTTLKSFKDFIVNKDIKVLIGFPREPQSLPCYSIMVAGEQETPLGLGDNIDDYEEEWDDEDMSTQYVIDGIDMDSMYRIECWSDNGDLTSYMYTILKYCLLSSRVKMLKDGFKLPKLTGTDLEPVPDYIPVFVYRRALMISFRFENLFFDDDGTMIGEGEYQLPVNADIDDVNVVQSSYNTD